MYNISLSNLVENQKQRIEWVSSVAHRELCTLKGQQETDCQNYIRVFARISNKKIMICGTNSYKPLCRYYVDSSAAAVASPSEINDSTTTTDNTAISPTYEMASEIEAMGQVQYNPMHNSTYIFTGKLFFV